MVCRLCLIDCETSIFIYSEENIQKHIAKFLHLELLPEDPISKVICARCWHQLNDFQVFCFEIEQAQKSLSASIDKTEETTFLNGSTEPSTKGTFNSEIIPEQLKEEKPEKQTDDCGSHDSIDYVDEDIKMLLHNEEKNVPTPSTIVSPKIKESIQTRSVSRQSVLQTSDQDHNNIPEIIKEKRKGSKKKQSKTNEATEEKEEEEAKKGANPNKKSKKKCDLGKQITSEEKAARSEKYLRHMQISKENDAIIQENMSLTCDICSMKFSNFTELKFHYRVNHQRRGYVVCCDKKLFKRGAIVDHIKLHTDPKHFRCKDCGKIMADRSSLQRHYIMFHPSEDLKTFPCDHCPEKFVTKYLLNLHSIKHVPKNYICSQCGKAFPTNSILNEHVKRRHSTVYDRMCEICAKLVRGKRAFERHMKEHEGIVQPQAQCLECGSWLKDKTSLRKHIYSKHDGKTHICNVCGKTAPSKSALYSHVKYMHELSAKFHCTFCDKSFKKAIHLREHTTTHTGEVLYTCPHCPATFNAQANMHSHRKKMHREEWEANRRYDKKKPNTKTD